MSIAITKALVADVLKNHQRYKWTLQGFGMLRTYLPNDVRLHVWDDRFAVPNVSLIHDHPWHFESLIVAGLLQNTRFAVMEDYAHRPGAVIGNQSRLHLGHAYMRRVIRPGAGFEVLSKDKPCALWPDKMELFKEGDVYGQRANEVHESRPVRGTVTVVQRNRNGYDDKPMLDEANVFYPQGGEWVSGEPREATPQEIEDIIGFSLHTWFQA